MRHLCIGSVTSTPKLQTTRTCHCTLWILLVEACKWHGSTCLCKGCPNIEDRDDHGSMCCAPSETLHSTCGQQKAHVDRRPQNNSLKKPLLIDPLISSQRLSTDIIHLSRRIIRSVRYYTHFKPSSCVILDYEIFWILRRTALPLRRSGLSESERDWSISRIGRRPRKATSLSMDGRQHNCWVGSTWMRTNSA